MRYKFVFFAVTICLLIVIQLCRVRSDVTVCGIKPSHPLVYDCFLFFNEADLLELRLEEMSEYVDRFVIVEAEETFRGNPKPLQFPLLKQRLERFSDKIIYVPVKGHFKTDSPWKRERFQRNQILQGLSGCAAKDIVFISDVDEIVRNKKIPEVIALLNSKEAEAIVVSQRMYFGYANRYQGSWKGPVATTYAQVKRLTPRIIRKLRHMKPRRVRTSHITHIHCLQEGGWHFSSLGDSKHYLEKIRAFSHAELDTERFTQEQNLSQLLKSYPLVPLDESFPTFLLENETHFRQIGFLDQ